MKFWITIANNAGTTQGDGPIINATYWEQTARMDKAGEFRFEMPATDPRAALIVADYRAKCYGLINGEVEQLGEGLIQKIELRCGTPGEEMLVVSGPDMLYELTWRGMDGTVCADDETGISPDAAKELDTGVNTDLPLAIDGNAGTGEDVTLAAADYLYLGYSRPVKNVAFDLDPGRVNNNVETMTVQYYDGDGWINVSTFVDGTLNGGATLGQDGTMSFDMPTDWHMLSHDEERRYWLRMTPSGLLDVVTINEITVTIDGKDAAPLATILAKAPGGWSLAAAGYAEAEGDCYLAFRDETVLQALRRCAETLGEHFHYRTGREIVWTGDDVTASGFRAIRGNVAQSAFKDNSAAALIESLERTADSRETATRVYPYGGGLGDSRVDLTLATQAMPANYTMTPASNVIAYEPAGTEPTPNKYAYKTWSDIRDASARDAQSVTAANTLAQRAQEWLQRHISANTAYSMKVHKLDGIVYPGQTIDVVWRRVRGDYEALDIDATLYILEATTRIDNIGVRTVNLSCGTSDVWPETDQTLVIDALENNWASRGHGGPVITQ